MIVKYKAHYNDAFWNYLSYQLRIQFNERNRNYNFIYPLEISNNSLIKKRKTTEPVIVNARILFNENGEEKEFLGKLVFGNYSRKAYVNTKGTDLTKCYPKSDSTEWIKIDESNRVIEIKLK